MERLKRRANERLTEYQARVLGPLQLVAAAVTLGLALCLAIR